MANGAGGHEAERLSVKVVPDTGGFAEDLKAFLEREEANAKIDVHLDIDTKEVEAKLKELSKDLTVKIDVELNDAGIQERLDALGKNLHVTVNADLDDKAAESRLALLTRAREVRLHVSAQNNGFAKLEHVVSGVSKTVLSTGSEITGVFQDVEGSAGQAAKSVSSIGSSFSQLGAIMQAAGTVIVVILVAALVNAVIAAVALAGAIALALAPAAFIAAGVAFALMASKGNKAAEKLKKDFEGVKKTLKSVVGDAVQPMIRALSKQVPQINKFLKSLKGNLSSAFTNASQYVDELTKALEKFTANALAGVAHALNDPSLQGLFTGLEKFAGDAGTAVGSFFTELATFGDQFGKVFAAAGNSLKTLAPALADVIGAFARVSPEIINEITQGILFLLQGLTNPDVLAGLVDISKLSFAFVIGSITILLGLIGGLHLAWTALEILTGVVLALIEVAWNKFWSFLKSLWSTITSATSTAWNATYNAVKKAVSATVNAVTGAGSSVKNAISSAWSYITSKTSSAYNSVLSKVKSVMSSLRSAVSSATSGVKNAFSSAWNFISGIINQISNAIGRISSAASRVKGVLGSLNPFGAARGPAKPGPDSPGDDPKPFAPMEMAVPKVEAFGAVAPQSITDSIDQINSVGRDLVRSFGDSPSDESSSSGKGFSAVAQKVFNFTINAAPNIPTEQTIVKALSYADALYAQ